MELIIAAIPPLKLKHWGVPRDKKTKPDESKTGERAHAKFCEEKRRSGRLKTTVGFPKNDRRVPRGHRKSLATGSRAHFSQEILEEVQQVFHGVKIYEMDELGKALHHRREESRRRRSTLQDAEVDKHYLGGSTGVGRGGKKAAAGVRLPEWSSASNFPVGPNGRGSDILLIRKPQPRKKLPSAVIVARGVGSYDKHKRNEIASANGRCP